MYLVAEYKEIILFGLIWSGLVLSQGYVEQVGLQPQGSGDSPASAAAPRRQSAATKPALRNAFPTPISAGLVHFCFMTWSISIAQGFSQSGHTLDLQKPRAISVVTTLNWAPLSLPTRHLSLRGPEVFWLLRGNGAQRN